MTPTQVLSSIFILIGILAAIKLREQFVKATAKQVIDVNSIIASSIVLIAIIYFLIMINI